ncbi:ATP-dependent RNA helicase MSS116 [Aspergillus filifer]
MFRGIGIAFKGSISIHFRQHFSPRVTQLSTGRRFLARPTSSLLSLPSTSFSQPSFSKSFKSSATMQLPVSTEGLQPFTSMAGKLEPKLLKALEVLNFEHMTPVQERILNELPNWRSDCLVQAKTGTGKTLAFLLPTLHCLIQGQAPPRGQVAVLIITPTRELAQQIAKSCDQLTSQLDRPLECHTAVGGTARASAHARFMKGNPSVLVATPGRLKDYLSESETARKLSGIQTLILDEADTMLEAGFLADVKHILSLIPPKSTGWQGMCFSATLPPKVKDVVSVVLKPGYSSISTIEANEAPTHERVPQYHVIIPSVTETFTTLTTLLNTEIKSNSKKIIVFGVTARMVNLFADAFSKGLTTLPVFEIHSRLSQSARTKTTEAFKEAGSGILFASDVIGRGMDFPNVDLVIQVGLPSNGEQYVHRVGRTARAGNDGRAVILLSQSESFFLRANKHLPIKPHPETESILSSSPAESEKVENAMHAVSEETKQRAYSSYIGFFAGSGIMKQLGLDKPGLVRLANDLAIKGMACPEPPAMDKKVVGKMGLKGVPGFNYASPQDLKAKPRGPPRSKPQNRGSNSAPQAKPRDALSPGAGGERKDRVRKNGGGGRGGQRGRGRGGGRGGRQ